MSEGGYGPPPMPGWSPPPEVGHQAPFHHSGRKPKRFGFVALFGAFVAGGVAATIAVGVLMYALATGLIDTGAVSATHEGASEGTETVQEGDCLTTRPDDADVNSTDEVVPCDRLHRTEVVGVVEVPGSRRWPSDVNRDLFISSACELAFESYVDVGALDSSLSYTAVAPTLEAARDGDRRVYCLVYSEDYRGGFGSVEDTGF